MIELRSDTFTLPTPIMLEAIARAELGNDDYQEDPTVRQLEALAAQRLGKERACLMPSGTMANLVLIKAQCSPERNTVIVGNESDIFAYESEGSALFGLVYLPAPTQADGTIQICDLKKLFDEVYQQGFGVSLVCLENPHNLKGGVVLPPGYLQTVAEYVHSQGAKLHLDGARLFNAAVASGTDPAEIVRPADSIQFCLSKGLAAPVGSMAVGDSDLIGNVRTLRKVLGGTMRQAGIIAAPGIVALEQMVARLSEDHRNARRLAEGLAAISGINLDLSTVQTNTVVFTVSDHRFTSESFIMAAHCKGVNFSEFRRGRIRAVVHHGTSETDVQQALHIVAQIMAEGAVNFSLSIETARVNG